MTLEELIAQVAAMKTEMAEKEAKANEEREKLKGKIGELIAEKKKLKNKARQPDPDDEDDEDDEAPPAKSKRSDPDLARVQRENADALTKLQEQLDAAKKKAQDAAIRSAMGDALNKANIAPEYRDAVEALLRTKRKLEVTDDDAVVLDGKPIFDSVAEWVKTEGRAYVKAPASGGSAANPSAPGGGVPQTKSRSKMSPAEKGKFIRENSLDAYNALPV